MKRSKLVLLSLAAALGAGSVLVPLTVADPSQDAKPAAGQQPEMQLPRGWTAADTQACMAAGTPGKMHEHLA